MIEEIHAELKKEMDDTIRSLEHDLKRVRTGRASADILDGVMVDYYGSDTPLNKLASISVPEPRLLVVQPFDAAVINDIDKAIRVADLGLSPINDGKVLKVPVPELSEERRRDLVKQVRKDGENHKISVRNHRRDSNDLLKQLLADKEISEDEHRRAHEKVQEITEEYTKKVDEIMKAKEAEVMAV